MNQPQPFVSIVTPFYNTADYLAECIESVLSQSFTNFEYVLVNNCSTDGSDAIARSYAARDPRIRVVDNARFVGQVENYNGALRAISATSKYCKMIQADDWMHPECVRQMVDLADQHPSVALVGAFNMLGDGVFLTGLPIRRRVFSGREICRRYFLEGLYVFGSPTALLMRADLVRSRHDFYRLDCPFEDAEVCFELLHDNDYGFIPEILTYTRRENTSLMTRVLTYHSPAVTQVLMMRRHGRTYLSDSEYGPCWRWAVGSYYWLLGQGLLRMREREFWRFQQSALATEGLSLNYLYVAASAVLNVLELVLNPFETVIRLTRFVSRLRSFGNVGAMFAAYRGLRRAAKHASGVTS